MREKRNGPRRFSFAYGNTPTTLRAGDILVFNDSKESIEFVRDSVNLLLLTGGGTPESKLYVQRACSLDQQNLVIQLVRLFTGLDAVPIRRNKTISTFLLQNAAKNG